MDIERFVSLMGSFAANTSEPEAMGAGRLLLREAQKEGVRLLDLFYRPDVLTALDASLKPVRDPAPDIEALQSKIEGLEGRLALVVPKATELFHSLKQEREKTAFSWMIGFSFVVFSFTDITTQIYRRHVEQNMAAVHQTEALEAAAPVEKPVPPDTGAKPRPLRLTSTGKAMSKFQRNREAAIQCRDWNWFHEQNRRPCHHESTH